MTRYVLGFVFDADYRNILLMRKKWPPWQEGMINGLGGKIEEGETPRQAMEREIREETCGKLVECSSSVGPFGKLVVWNSKKPVAEVWLFHGQIASEFPLELDHVETPEGSLVVMRMEMFTRHLFDDQTGLLVPNLRYLVPMAYTRARSTGFCSFFEISETDDPKGAG